MKAHFCLDRDKQGWSALVAEWLQHRPHNGTLHAFSLVTIKGSQKHLE